MQMTVRSCKPFIMMFKNISVHLGKYNMFFSFYDSEIIILFNNNNVRKTIKYNILFGFP